MAPIEQHQNNLFDLFVWSMLQWYYWPHYIIGKQDEWKDWVGSSLNGWRHYTICK